MSTILFNRLYYYKKHWSGIERTSEIYLHNLINEGFKVISYRGFKFLGKFNLILQPLLRIMFWHQKHINIAFPPILARNKDFIFLHDLTQIGMNGSISSQRKFFFKILMINPMNRAIGNCNTVLFQSKFVINEFNKYQLGYKQQKIILAPIVPNFINYISTEKDEKLFLSVGALTFRKRSDKLISYFEKYITEKKINYKLILVGKNLDNIEIVKSRNIIYLEYVSDSKLKELYKLAKYHISISSYEGMYYPYFEAANFGCIQLSPKNSGAYEYAVNDDNGTIWEDVYDYKIFKESLDSLCSMKHLNSITFVRNLSSLKKINLLFKTHFNIYR